MRLLPIVVLASVLVLVGCAKEQSPSSSASADQVKVEATLAAADAADGTVDRTVAKCAVCSLGMDGKPEYASTHAGYELHLCSAHCKETFDNDPATVIAKLDKS